MLTRFGCFTLQTAKRGCGCNGNSKALRGFRYKSSYLHDYRPLRILFCGSDEFSITSLQALHKHAKSDNSNVASIEVATKTDKRTGRGLKTIKPPPIKAVAQELGLPVHQFDSFRGWHMPTSSSSGQHYINMVIAVSFGLLVPPRILAACEFGGLNVHPSMLPDLKGSTPIEHAIINGYTTTGVTVQTLHPSRFDEGNIVLQTPFPGIHIPDPEHITSLELRNFLAPVGAELLVRSLREGLYLRQQPTTSTACASELHHAPKLSPEARHVNFRGMASTHILRLHRALGRLWIRPSNIGGHQADTRLILESDLRLANTKDLKHIPSATLDKVETGVPFTVTDSHSSSGDVASILLVKCADGNFLCIPTIRMSGSQSANSATVAAKANLLQAAEPVHGDLEMRKFRHLPD